MEAFITSCGRPDLLCQTIESFQRKQKTKVFITIHEDGLSKIGQHESIEMFLQNRNDKYYIHCEEDWDFENYYDWVRASVSIMKADPMVIKVLCRADSPHPCEYKNVVLLEAKKSDPGAACETMGFGYVEPWESPDGILWHGFSWNPGVTRMDLLKQFMPFPRWEQEVAKEIYDAGYKVVMLETGVCRHIGNERSTH